MSEAINYIKKSFELKSQNRFKQSIDMLYKALTLEPNSLEILSELGQLYFLLQKIDRASYYANKVLELEPNHHESTFLLQEIYIKQQKFSEAKKLMDKIFGEDPSDTNLIKKIELLEKIDDKEALEEIFNSKSQLSPQVLYKLSTIFGKEKSLELLENALEKDENNQKITLALAKLYFEIGQTQKSKELFLKLDVQNDGEILNHLGLFDLEALKYSSAIKYFEKACAMEENAQYFYNLASAYFLNGWLDEAQNFFMKAIQLDPKNEHYHYSLAYLYFQQKNYEKASSELKHSGAAGHVLLSLILAKNGDLLKAKSDLENHIKIHESDDFALFSLGKINQELLLADLAVKNIEKAVELNPKSIEYLINLSEIYIAKKEFDKAQKIAESILDINDKYIYAYVILAEIELNKNEFDECFEIAQKIIKLDENCAQGYYYNALALFNQHDTTFAIESLKKSISLDLENASLYMKMSEFYQDLGQFKLAFDWAKEACDIDDRNYTYKWLTAKCAGVLKNEKEAVKYYSQAHRLAQFDEELANDYAKYLTKIGNEKQASAILKKY